MGRRWTAVIVVPSALTAAAFGQEDRARPRLLESVMEAACYVANPTDEERQEALDRWGAWPPTLIEEGDARFFTTDDIWRDEATLGPAGQARSAHLTYSFPADGVLWGSATSGTGPNNLNAKLITMFGSANLDRGREYLRQALASWRRHAGLTYDEVADDNAGMNTNWARLSTRGDIRFGGFPTPGTAVLARNFFPGFGGDVVFNTVYFDVVGEDFRDPSHNFRYLRNVMAHEHGHGVGFLHVVPCNAVFLMEPFAHTGVDMLQVDERRGAGNLYGDRFSGNHSALTARDLGDVTLRRVYEADLSTNGSAGPNNTDEDWFRFSLASVQTVTIDVTPTGGSYTNGLQTDGCFGTTAIVRAFAAGDLAVELRDQSGLQLLAAAGLFGAGSGESLTVSGLPAGTYTVRVVDVGPNPTIDQFVQAYTLSIRGGSSVIPPTVFAGINKRVQASTNCFFVGDVNTATYGIPLSSDAYDWDLDGDGTFETMDNPQPSRQYPSNGVYPVTLRVTAVEGASSTDTILVRVHGATTRVLSVLPSMGGLGTMVPVEIGGSNLKNVTSASMVSVSGGGVTVIGTPTPNAVGTMVNGLSFVVSPGATLGRRSVTVTNSDGTGTGVDVFEVIAAPPAMPGPFDLLSPADGSSVATLTPMLTWGVSANAEQYQVVIFTSGTAVIEILNETVAGTSLVVPIGVLGDGGSFTWQVDALNGLGATRGTPMQAAFTAIVCFGDADSDGFVGFADVTEVLTFWGQQFAPGEPGPGDADRSGSVNFGDVVKVLENWGLLCG